MSSKKGALGPIQILIHIFASLRLTVILLSFAGLLVFFGTLDQVHLGIHEVQKRYFQSFFVLWNYPPTAPYYDQLKWFALALPGGYLLGAGFIVNLITAHFKYFRASWKKLGIAVIHIGVLLLVVSGFASSAFQEESQMWLKEGEAVSFSENVRMNELVIIDTTDPEKDLTTAFPESLIKKGYMEDPSIPFGLKVEAFWPNASLAMGGESDVPNLATKGAGDRMGIRVFPQPISYEENAINAQTTYVTVVGKEGPIGTWLLSNLIDERFPPQTFSYAGKEYSIALRFKRYNYPFSIELIQFTHTKHPGTDIPKDFSSLVRIRGDGEDRKTLIYMNNPLRYAGSTFYQASFTPDNEQSMLQVVQNPARLLPYIAVWTVAAGLIIQFCMHLIRFIKKQKA